MFKKLIYFFCRSYKISRNNLLKKSVKGDENALRQLVYKYHDELVRYAVDYVKSRSLSEKIVEQVFAEVWNNPHKHQVDFDASASDNLHKITCRLVFDYLQKTASDLKLKREIWKSLLQTSISIEDEKIRAEVLNFTLKSLDNLSLQKELIQSKINSIS